MDCEASFFRQNKWLYHFTKFSTAKKIIKDNRLKYSLLRKTNDSCEYAKCIFNQYYSPEEENIVEKIENELYHYRQISLTEDKSVFGRKGFDLQQMWGLYADSGYGVCLVFDKYEFIGSLNDKIIHGPVSYKENLTSGVFTEVVKSQDVVSYVENNAKTLFFNKRKEWEHEQEYRVIQRFDDINCVESHDFKDSLKYVILCCSKNTKPTESVVSGEEYFSLRQFLPKDIKILIYAPYIDEQLLICYDKTSGGEIYWNASEDYMEFVDVDI